MSTNEKLRSIGQRTTDLYRKAMEFDSKMIQLNKEFGFLDKKMDYEAQRITQDKIPTNQYFGLGVPSTK